MQYLPQRDLTTDGGGHPDAIKIKRTRKPWVYKEDYDRVLWQCNFFRRVAIVLLVAFILALKFAVQ